MMPGVHWSVVLGHWSVIVSVSLAVGRDAEEQEASDDVDPLDP